MIEAFIGGLGSAVILLGLTLATVGLYGMLRRRDVFEQLHAAGLVTGPAVILILLASLASGSAEITTSALLVVVFVLITSSLSTHVIALAAWRLREESAQGLAVEEELGEAVPAGMTPRSPMRVLLAHDGSQDADVALALAASLSWPDDTLIRVIGVVEGDLEPAATEPLPAPARAEPVELAPTLDAAVVRIRRDGLAVDAVVRSGDPATAIASESETFGAHLVVIGSRGLGRVQSALLGSVTDAVVDRAACPVLVARAPAIRELLLATEGSDTGIAATEALAQWPIFEGMRIRVLSVAAATREPAQTARHRDVAEEAALRLRRAGRRASPHIRIGDAAAGIVSFAEEASIDLIVLGSRGHTGLKRTFLGSVARDVMQTASTSVLIVSAQR